MAESDARSDEIAALRVSFVDDNRYMRSVMHAMLQQIGVENVRLSKSVSAAKEAICEFKPDIVITDLRMGPPDGIDLVNWLRDPDDSPNHLIPIILLTGHSDEDHVTAARDAGVNLFMIKPVSASALEQRLSWLLDNPLSFVPPKPGSASEEVVRTYVGWMTGKPTRRKREPFAPPPETKSTEDQQDEADQGREQPDEASDPGARGDEQDGRGRTEAMLDRRARSRDGARVRPRKPKPAARSDRQHTTNYMLVLIFAGITVTAGFIATVWLRDLLPNF